MSTSDIIRDRKKSLDKQKEKVEEVVMDKMAEELNIRSDTETEQPKKRGRPKTVSKSKSPSRDYNIAPEAKIQKTEEVSTIASRLKARQKIKELKYLRATFPEVLEADLARVNPHACSLAELDILLDACRTAVRDAADICNSSDFFPNLLKSGEGFLLQFAAHSSNDKIRSLILLKNFTDKCKQDPVIATDLKLLSCTMNSYMPDHPAFRIIFNMLKIAFDVYNENATIIALSKGVDNPKYSEF